MIQGRAQLESTMDMYVEHNDVRVVWTAAVREKTQLEQQLRVTFRNIALLDYPILLIYKWRKN